ncbi:TOMM precursor leader peptide-binding protein [Actinomycetospora aeridis]|uniref:TOMM leader peptide-binding protein n=1 Tax=Actinomycetospora aeridis TaxID=3129231 RepID=A0ABU8N089_9PSEU
MTATDDAAVPGQAVAGSGAIRVGRHLRLEPEDGGLVVIGEDGLVTVWGRAAAAVATLVDGRRDADAFDVADLVAAAPDGVAPADVVAVLERLRALGVLEDADPADRTGDGRAEREAFHRAATGRTLSGIPPTVVALHDLGDRSGARALAGALEASGLRVRRPEDPDPGTVHEAAQVAVVAVDDHLDPRLGELAERFRADGVPWLPVRVRGVRQWIGPFFGADADGPCWHCLGSRLRIHRRAEEALLARRGDPGPLARRLPSHPAAVGLAAHRAALEVDAWAHGHTRPVHRGVLVLDSRTTADQLHELRRRPQCPGCGDAGLVARRGRAPIALGPAPDDPPCSVSAPDGYVHLVSPVTGVVPVLEVAAGAVGPTMVARTGPTPPARALALEDVRRRTRIGNAGTGPTERAARAAALGEALERWSGQYHGDEMRVRARRGDLGADALDPRDVLLVDPRQSADPAAWNAAHGPFNHIGPPVDDTEETDWSPLWSLRDGAARWLPTAMLYHGAPGPSWAFADSSGCAAGPTRDEAIRGGLLELVERDAVALWWYHRTPMPAVDLTADADGRRARDAHGALGREVWALDLTTDLGVPVVAAVSAARRHGVPTDRVMLGLGADPDPSTALHRALGELTATTEMVVEGARVPDDPDVRRWLDEVDVASEPWLVPSAAAAPPADPVAGTGAGPLVDRLVAHGLEPLVLDQTRPDIGLPVVRTVVPTLRPMWARFAPGRLFDAPVALGRLATPTPYDELNPRPVFL